ncbi:MAG TPA: FAD-binding oxidoreductase [Stenomitos sp.]
MMKWWGWGAPDKAYSLERKPQFWPFLEARLGPAVGEPAPVVALEAIALPPSRLSVEHRKALAAIVGADAVTTDHAERVRHSYGKSYRDLVRIRRGEVLRAPDAIVYPGSHEEVQAVLDCAREAGWRVIPFGGGTSVVGGVEVPPEHAGEVFVTLDLARMDRVLSVDAVSGTARIQAGVFGPALEEQLGREGHTLGHFPQSFEFSTLGGWIATRSAGQQSTRYGKIEEMVVGLRMATPRGTFEVKPMPAQAAGPSLKELVVGSEGLLGVITEATVKIHRLPPVRDYRGYLVPSFEAGMQAIRALMRQDLRPATVRLSDRQETELLFRLREATTSPVEDLIQRAGKYFLTRGGTVEFEGRCMLLVGFEGEASHVVAQWEVARPLLKHFDALSLGASVGRSWFKSRFDLPYLRDTLLDRGVMVDTLETATEWANLPALYQAVDRALREAIAGSGVAPFVMCHVSHAYHDGASLYFTFAGRQLPGRELEQWADAKRVATDCLVRNGGALSHHHAIGLDHAPWMREYVGSIGIDALAALKDAFDPTGYMNPGKLFGDRAADSSTPKGA